MITAITINLLAEEQLAEEQSARDPVKTTIAIGVAVLACVALVGSLLWLYASGKNTEAMSLESQWKKVSNDQSVGAMAEFNTLKGLANDLVAMNHARKELATQMALVKDLLPESIALTRVNFSMSTETLEGPAPPPDDNSGKVRRPPQPKTIERIALQIEGKATSNRPEIEVDNFIQSMKENPQVSSQISQIQLRSISRSTTGAEAGAAGQPTAFFVIECQYKEQS